jgi:DNA ligase D-like protein (predicted polymerase)
MSDAITIDVGGTEVTISHPDKVFFAKRGETKLDLVRYYQAVAEPLLATLQGRPVLLERYPDGASGKSFFQKRVPKSAPPWLTTTVVSTPNGTASDALVAVDLAHIIWAVNIGCIGFHVWPFHAATPEITDELRVDLDPSPGVGFPQLQEAAARTQDLFDELGIEAHLKTSGSRGLHIYVELQPRWDGYEVRAAAVALARELEVVTPTASPRSGGRKSGAPGCSWTSIRTLPTRPCSARGACAHGWERRFRPRSLGTSWRRSSPTPSPSPPCRPALPSGATPGLAPPGVRSRLNRCSSFHARTSPAG